MLIEMRLYDIKSISEMSNEEKKAIHKLVSV